MSEKERERGREGKRKRKKRERDSENKQWLLSLRRLWAFKAAWLYSAGLGSNVSLFVCDAHQRPFVPNATQPDLGPYTAERYGRTGRMRTSRTVASATQTTAAALASALASALAACVCLCPKELDLLAALVHWWCNWRGKANLDQCLPHGDWRRWVCAESELERRAIFDSLRQKNNLALAVTESVGETDQCSLFPFLLPVLSPSIARSTSIAATHVHVAFFGAMLLFATLSSPEDWLLWLSSLITVHLSDGQHVRLVRRKSSPLGQCQGVCWPPAPSAPPAPSLAAAAESSAATTSTS